MGLKSLHWVTCDRCPNEAKAQAHKCDDTAQKLAEQAGWTHTDHRDAAEVEDLCPTCSQ